MNSPTPRLPPSIRRHGPTHLISETRLKDHYNKYKHMVLGPRQRAWLHDGGGLDLLKRGTGGGFVWIQHYSFLGKSRGPAHLGTYPDMSLEEARAAGLLVRQLAAQSIEPVEHRRASEMADRVEAEARTKRTLGALLETMVASDLLLAESTTSGITSRLENHLKPIADVPIDELTIARALEVVEKAGEQSGDVAYRICVDIRAAAHFALQRGLIPEPAKVERLENPYVVRQYLQSVEDGERHRPAILDVAELGRILFASENSTACWQIKGALRLIAFAAERTKVTCQAEWAHFNLEEATWNIPRKLMKVRRRRSGAEEDPETRRQPPTPHVKCLSTQLVAFLRTLPREGRYLFPSKIDASKPITCGGLESHMKIRLGLKDLHTPTSYRASQSTWVDNQIDPDGYREKFSVKGKKWGMDHQAPRVQRAYERKAAISLMHPIQQGWGDVMEAAERAAADAAHALSAVAPSREASDAVSVG